MKEDLRLDFEALIDFAKSFGDDEEECWGNLEHAYNVLFDEEGQLDDPFSPERDNNEYIVGIISCAADYAYNETLQAKVYEFHGKVWDILIG